MNHSRNPYIDSNGSPTLKRSVVGFIDILGYKEMIKSENSSQDLLAKLHNILKLSIKHVDPRTDDDILGCIPERKDHSAFRTFTDNIVIGYPIYGDGEVELYHIFNNLSSFQINMTIKGFFVRGAIVIGDLYMDDILVFGDGLIQAYEAETKLARDPRIVLTSSAKDAVDKYIGYYPNSADAPQNRTFLQDSDGQYFVNYLDCLIDEDNDLINAPVSDTEALVAHKEQIEKKMNDHKSNPYIWAKYLWAANYHNYFCEQHTSTGDDSLKIDIKSLQLMPTRIICS